MKTSSNVSHVKHENINSFSSKLQDGDEKETPPQDIKNKGINLFICLIIQFSSYFSSA